MPAPTASEINALMADVRAHIQTIEPGLIELRRHLHAFPELSRTEFETTSLLSDRLRGLGFEVHVRPQGNGLFADLVPPGWEGGGRTVAVRADIDALPIMEQTGLPFASKHTGVMHACGHDVHTSCAMGVAEAVAAVRERLPGRLRLFFQHCEESTPGGADELIAMGCMEGVEVVIGLHVDPELPVGQIGLRVGALTASSDIWELKVHGRSGHGARPHHAVDPVFITSLLIQELYRAPAHHFDVRDPVVISVGTIHGGDTVNVIPQTVTMAGTVRTLSRAHRSRVEPLLRRIAHGICSTHGATYELRMEHGASSIMNDRGIVDVVEEVATALIGRSNVQWIELPSMGAEDFSAYLEHAPGMMMRLGANDGGETHFLHSPRFSPDERAIALGATVLAQSALRLMATEAAGS